MRCLFCEQKSIKVTFLLSLLFDMRLLRSASPLILGSLAAKAGCSYLGPPKTMSQYFQRRDAILAKTPSSPLQP